MQVKYKLLTFLLWICVSFTIFGQDICNPTLAVDTSGYEGVAIFNYASTSKIKNQKYQSALALGQIFTGYIDNSAYNSNVGFYGRYLLPPFALKVNATQGDLLDRIQLTWELDALGPSPNEGFNIYRNGIFLATVGPNIRNYNDFNVIAGLAYTYSVRGLNAYGEGTESYALGFQVPNGVVTGWIRTQSGSPVSDAVVSLMPMQGFSASFGYSDKASAIAEGTSMFLTTNQNWSTTFWVKTDTALTQATVMSYGKMLLYVRAIQSSTGQEGIMVANSPSAAPFLTAVFPDSVKHDWNHIALTFEDASSLLRIYLNGGLVQQATFNDLGITGETTAEEESWRLGNVGHPGGWKGKIDEVRIYNTLLAELDLPEIMHGTASSLTPNLKYYWKMDEELGDKSYDLLNRVKLFFCGAKFDTDRPPVRTAGKTNNEGYYRIESASYGTGTTFLAEPSKFFYLHKSVKFTSSQSSNISLPNFALPKKATIELWVNTSGAASPQTILSKKSSTSDFKVYLEPSGINHIVKVAINGNSHSFGNLGTGFQHLALVMDSVSNNVQVYKNGISVGSHTFPGSLGNLEPGGHTWRLGVQDNGALTDYFNGLIDEVAVYDTILNPTQILNHFQESRDILDKDLYVYFPMDEGSGNRVSNVGSKFLDFGTGTNIMWSSFAPNQEEQPHIFTPTTRQVTLNPSVTSVDQVDFTDRSTVAVSGYIRYKNTDCFAPNVEILVNGTSFSPKIFTDSLGKFIIDFDPGSTARLEPKFENHVFVPAFWDVTNVNSPIAGIIFNDITTRKVSGIVAGGSNPDCKKSIIRSPPGSGQGTVCIVEVRAVNGCLVRAKIIDNQEGEFEFLELPPLENMTVAVIEHSDDDIKTAFQVQGGSNVDLTKKDTIINFIYIAPPEVEINGGLDPLANCFPEVIVIEKSENITVDIKVKETYIPILGTNNDTIDSGVCYLDTANIQIINGFADNTLDTTMSNSNLQYKFRVGNPNPSPPYLKTIQVIATSVPVGRIGTLVKQAIVTGTLNKLQTFTTMLPFIPSVILRDPPGDGSSSYLEKTEKICKTTELSMQVDAGVSAGVEIEVAPTIQFVVAPFGLGKIVTIDPDFQLNIETEVTYSKVKSNSFQTCVSFNNKISTSDGSLVVGGAQGGDLYVGEAINIIFGFADKVSFDSCMVNVEQILEVEPGNFATTFVYSEFNIKNNVLRYLNELSEVEGIDSTTEANYLESINRWEDIIALNDSLKLNAELIRNLSFDAGVEYEYSETADTTSSSSDQNGINTDSKIGTTFGFSGDNAGAKFKINALVKSSNTWKTENGTEKGLTTGYILKDDDPGDAFTVDVAMDSVYKTPVFRIKAGQSSCPWEPGTANREAPNLQLGEGSQFTAVNVPANEPAVFKLNLGNLSATNEDWTYGFTALAASNPDGAIIKLNGQALNNNTIKFLVPYGTSIPVTLTVERGPIAYEYEDLKVALVSDCELERDFGLSLQSNPMFVSALTLGVNFIRPCSEVNINVPEQNWVVINNDPLQPGTLRRITVSGYDLNSPDFQLIRMQYRRTDGNGAWINLPTEDDIYEAYNTNWSGFSSVPNNPDTLLLQPDFTQFMWDTDDIADGNYEIHAWAVCSGDASNKPGFSDIIKGKIDRQPPSLVGVPQPSDGVYHVGDEISFTFNQDINCQRFMAQLNSAKLFKAATNTPLVISKSCVGNKVVIIPDPIFNDNEELENTILRAEVNNIQDLTGNINPQEIWEFYVDRNELAWLTDSIEVVKFVDETKTISAKIHNRGGYPVPFSIIDVPDWLHVYPDRGTLVANEVEEIFFTVKDDIDLGEISDNVVLRTETGINPFFMGGDEPLHVKARNLCRPESWVLNPGSFKASDYDLSMNFVVQLNIEGTLSADENDIVGAYVDGQLRGIAKVEYVASQNKYLAFLTVYGDTAVQQIKFQIWDASDCKLYAYAVENFMFKANDVKGTISNCIILHTNTTLLRKIFIHEGWNWLSMNLDLVPNTINNALMSLSNPTGAYIQGQTGISGYEEIGSIWVGSLNNLLPTKLYQYLSEHKDSLSIIGNYIDPTSRPMPLDSGWNWIGYLPTQSLAINDALATINATEGDIIKSQLQFAQYQNGTGWIGNLKTMNAPNGYLLRLNKKDTLIYPDPLAFRSGTTSSTRNLVETNQHGMTDVEFLPAEAMPFERWQVNPAKYEHTMSIIAIVLENENNENILHDGDEVGAFVNNEVRGSGKAIHIPSLNAYMIFMTVYANFDGEKLTFKFFDASSNKEMKIAEEMNFKINKIVGKVSLPEPLHVNTTTATNELGSETDFNVFPNPFNSTLTVKYKMIQGQDVKLSIKDIQGKVVEFKEIPSKSGMNVFEWKPSADLIYGVYLLSIESNENTVSKKVLYLK